MQRAEATGKLRHGVGNTPPAQHVVAWGDVFRDNDAICYRSCRPVRGALALARTVSRPGQAPSILWARWRELSAARSGAAGWARAAGRVVQALVIVIPAWDGVASPRRSGWVCACVDENVLDLVTRAVVPKQAGTSGFGLVECQRHLLETLLGQLAVGWTETVLVSTAVTARTQHQSVRAS